MTHQIKTSSFHSDVLEWLQENVGDLLWSKPIIEWHGRGWHMVNQYSIVPYTVPDLHYVITVDDPKLAILTSLRWS